LRISLSKSRTDGVRDIAGVMVIFWSSFRWTTTPQRSSQKDAALMQQTRLFVNNFRGTLR
jgi:hypothetical protein